MHGPSSLMSLTCCAQSSASQASRFKWSVKTMMIVAGLFSLYAEIHLFFPPKVIYLQRGFFRIFPPSF